MENGSVSKVIPESVMEAVNRTRSNIDEVQANLEVLLSYCDTETLSTMVPLDRARSLLLIAKTTTTLFALRLRCRGVDPDDHPVKKEFERLSLYQAKLQRCIDLSKAPLRPSTTINTPAAARFIEHSLPDLSSEQKQNMRGISRGEGNGFKYVNRNLQKKRKYQSSEKQSIPSVSQGFLEKAAHELLGDNKNGVKGPYNLWIQMMMPYFWTDPMVPLIMWTSIFNSNLRKVRRIQLIADGGRPQQMSTAPVWNEYPSYQPV